MKPFSGQGGTKSARLSSQWVMEPNEVKTYHDILKAQFSERCARNPRYSLRAFARDLAISPGRLSEILRGKQGLSARYARLIAQRLELSSLNQDYFCALVQYHHARSLKAQERYRKKLQQIESEIKIIPQ